MEQDALAQVKCILLRTPTPSRWHLVRHSVKQRACIKVHDLWHQVQ